MGILLNWPSVQLGILYIFYGMSSNVMAWQNSFFMSRFPKHKTQYAKFQTFVSLYLAFSGNIAKWSVSPTWKFIHIFYGMSSNVMAWQNSFFKSRLPNHKNQYVKFLTSVSLHLYFERNIANWIVNPTWNIVYFRRLWGQTSRLGKTHSSRADCRNIKNQYAKFQTFVSLYLNLNGNIANWSVSPTWIFIYISFGMSSNVMIGKTHSSWADCRNIKPNMSSF